MKVGRIIAPVLAFIAILTMFLGWIKINDDEGFIDEAMEEFEEFMDEYDELDSDELDEFDELLKDAKTHLSSKKIIKSFESCVKTLKDGAIAPSEIAINVGGLLDVCNKLTHVSKHDAEDLYDYLGDIDDVADIFSSVATGFGIYRFFFWATIILFALTGLFTGLGNKVGTLSAGITSMVFIIIWFALFGIIALGGADALNLTIAPYLSVICTIAAFVVGITSCPRKNKTFESAPVNAPVNASYDNGYTVPQYSVPVSTPNAPQRSFCGGCGAEITNGAQFCPICGNKQY